LRAKGVLEKIDKVGDEDEDDDDQRGGGDDKIGEGSGIQFDR
jgi:hypothetical protein